MSLLPQIGSPGMVSPRLTGSGPNFLPGPLNDAVNTFGGFGSGGLDPSQGGRVLDLVANPSGSNPPPLLTIARNVSGSPLNTHSLTGSQTGAPQGQGVTSTANAGSTSGGHANAGGANVNPTNTGATGQGTPGTSGGQILPYSAGGGVAPGQGLNGTPGTGTAMHAGAFPGAQPAPYSPGPGGASSPGYGGGPSPSPTYPNVGAGLVRRAGPFGNQIGLGTLGDYLFHASGGDRALNRNELMGALGVSSPIADTLLSTVGDGMTVPVQSLIEAFRPYSFDGINISDQGIDMALRETMGPVQANFFSFADPNGNLSMGGFAAIAREAMNFLGMPQPNPAMLSAAFRRLAGMDGVADISDASAMLPIGPDGSFSLGEMGGAIMNLLSTAPTPGGFGPPWSPPFGGPPPYSPGPFGPFTPTFPPAFPPAWGGGFGMTRGQFGAMVNGSSQWTGQYFHPAQIDAAYRNIGMMDGYPGVSPWEAGMAFGSAAPSPFQVSSGVAAHSWPSYPYAPPYSPWRL